MVAMRHLLMGIIRIYQLAVSPLLGPRCRFHPSCSCYALTAIERHGALRGSWLGTKRLLRCHPFSEGGYDPVPDRRPIPDKRPINA
jgi:putative membrane protein insertion efficiency factor